MANKTIEGYRLSPQQRHVWLLGSAEPASPYRALAAYSLDGYLDKPALLAAIRAVIDRHEILRTRFESVSGLSLPAQVIDEPTAPTVKELDLTGEGDAVRQRRLREIIESAEAAPLDQNLGAPIQISLIALSQTRHMLLVTLPALCADTATLNVLLHEVASAYQAAKGGRADLDAPLQYADFSEWQNDLLESEASAAKADFWRHVDLPTFDVKLPGEYAEPLAREFAPREVRIELAAETSAGLAGLADEMRTTEYTLLLACWQALLSGLTGRSELVVGAAFDGRNYAELEGAMGLFEKYLPVPSFSRPGASLGSAARALDEYLAEAREWQESFAWEAMPQRKGAPPETPYFAVGFDYQDQFREHSASGVKFSTYYQSVRIDRFKVAAGFARNREGLAMTLRYDENVFSEQEALRLASRLETLLESAIRTPLSTIGELEILDGRERQQILQDFNQTAVAFDSDMPITRLFELQAERAPEEIAVVFEQGRLSFAQLNFRANQLAHHLIARGAGPEEVVAICLGRSLEMVVALVAVLKSGAVYLPLDPSLPDARLNLMLEDASPCALVTEEAWVGRFSKRDLCVVSLDGERDAIDNENSNNPVDTAAPANLAYVIYTSGSEGKPKGVAVEHRQVSNYVASVIERLDLEASASFATVSTFSADLGNTVIFPALCMGRCLHVLSQDRASDPEALADYFTASPVDVLKIVPSHLKVLLGGLRPGAVLPRRRLILGGETSDWSLIERIDALKSGCVVFNHYGPTETTIGVLTHRVAGRGRKDTSLTPPLGRPLANTRIYILNDRGGPVPIGVAGELHIGGLNVARGYLNRPDLTAERFIPDPFSGEAGARLYRTGDLARHLPDGAIEFLGRIDDQVKIRGYRVELREVEAALCQHPHVKAAVAMMNGHSDSDEKILAYVVKEEGAETPDLRGFLQERLPNYMVPAAFIELDELPLTANGKIDRRALPSPEARSSTQAEKSRLPRNPVEDILAGIFCEVLRLDGVGMHDDFFELGGHSLLATQVVSRVRAAFKVEIPMRVLFDSPTVAALAPVVEEAIKAHANLVAPPLERVPRTAPLPLSFAQQRLWFLDRLEPGSPFYNCPGAVRLIGPFNTEALEQSLNEVIRRHEVLRTTFVTVDSVATQVIAPSLAVGVGSTDLGHLPEPEREEEARRIASEEAAEPFNLSEGPLVRARVLRMSEDDHVVLFTTHHIVSDGWSMGVLLREVTTLYNCFSQGQPSPLEELPVQYADFAVWQREWLQGEVLENQLAYWREQLADLTTLELPTAAPRPAVQTYRGAHGFFTWPRELSDALKSLSRREGVTLFMTLLAGFQALLYRYTGQTDIAVGTDLAGRNRSEIEGLIGFFINQLVLRTDLSGEPSFRELLKRVREVALGAYTHQDVPFEKLVEELQPQRDTSRAPLFQVKLVLQNAGRQADQPEELDQSTGPLQTGIGVEIPTAKFDLTVAITDTTAGLRVLVEYSTELFTAEMIDRMIEHFQHLMEGAAEQPDLCVGDLPLMNDAQRRLILLDWNRTSHPFDSHLCAHQLFERQAHASPHHIAVVFEGQKLSYSELDRRANRLACYLRARGVGPEERVGLCLERGIDLIVSLLAVLKAGGGYVPLDPSYPFDRLSFMLDDSQISFLITQDHLVDNLPNHWSQVICIDSEWEMIAAHPDAQLPNLASPSNLAYLIYTSGSSGRPKAVMLAHYGLANLISAQSDAFALLQSDRVLQFSSLSFDASVFEFVMALLSGAQLHLAPREKLLPGPGLAHLLADRCISILVVPPTALLATPPADLPHLRTIVFAGEPLSAELLSRWSAPHRAIFNAYGPTEATIWATASLCQLDDSAAPPPIGRPINNVTAFVLDPRLELCPVGVPGEIYIGGAGVGRGYWRRPDLTADRFLPDAFGQQAGSRLYRTGDVGKYRADGAIDYLGRADQQVKLRGYRIELGEVEAVLMRQAGVTECAVALKPGEGGEARLVAYVVMGGGEPMQEARLREAVRKELPDYMVPAAYVEVGQMPLSGSGKLDRASLPEPGEARPDLSIPFLAPRNAIEEVLAGIWSQLLGVEQVGVNDNFFDLGGHSLLATQVVSRAETVFQQEVPVRALFESPTVATLAQAIVEGEEESGRSEKIARVLLKVKALSASDVTAMLEPGDREEVSA